MLAGTSAAVFCTELVFVPVCAKSDGTLLATNLASVNDAFCSVCSTGVTAFGPYAVCHSCHSKKLTSARAISIKLRCDSMMVS